MYSAYNVYFLNYAVLSLFSGTKKGKKLRRKTRISDTASKA
jgi:hypothetical protein